MAEKIEVVIKIPEYYLTHPQDYSCLAECIRRGVLLPKGHGRLIDADEFHRTLEDMPMKDTDKWFNWLQKVCNRLAEAPTIVEADTESEG